MCQVVGHEKAHNLKIENIYARSAPDSAASMYKDWQESESVIVLLLK